MAYEGYGCLRVRAERGVARVTIDHPPINLLDAALFADLARLSAELEADDEVRVIVLQSANPEFFIAHADVQLIQQLPTTPQPRPTQLGVFHQLGERFRTMPRISIGVVEGRARGGGSELLLSLDMRFGALGRAILSQPEVAVGILPGGCGTQRLPRLLGRARAAEVIFGCGDFPADLAERYGWLNRALPADELGPFVDELAQRIASFPAEAIRLAKQALNAAELPLVEGLLEEQHCFNLTLTTPAAQARMARFLELGGQTRETELEIAGLYAKLAELR